MHNLEAKYLNKEISSLVNKKEKKLTGKAKATKMRADEVVMEQQILAAMQPIDKHGKFINYDDQKDNSNDSDDTNGNKDKKRHKRTASKTSKRSAAGTSHSH